MPRMLAGEALVLPPLRRHWMALIRRLLFQALIATVLIGCVDGFSPAAINDAADSAAENSPYVRSMLLAVATWWNTVDTRLLVTLAILALLSLVTIAAWFGWLSTTLTLTDQRFIYETGGLTLRRSRVIPLDRVQDVSAVQTLLGRILDYGHVDVDVVGSFERFRYMNTPEMLRDQVFVLSEQLRRGL